MMPRGEREPSAGWFGEAFHIPVGKFDDGVWRTASCRSRACRWCDHVLVLHRQMLIADQSIWPEVGHLDFQIVITGMHRFGDIDHKRRLPDIAHVSAVDADFRDRLDLS